MNKYYYKVEQTSNLHRDLEYPFFIKGQFMQDRNEEISSLVGIEDLASKAAYDFHGGLLINEAYADEIDDKHFIRKVQELDGRVFKQFKKSSSYFKKWDEFIKENNLIHAIRMQSLNFLVFVYGLTGAIEFITYNGTFYLEAKTEQENKSLIPITEREFLEMKLEKSDKAAIRS
ncbi:hypothetical protein [Bacillus pumilus]|uniref:hypothetical protein n=2 Tax=Bacillus pumilus TaxID=1408 RepID=UPI0022800859|nr:hypothetical protein [Bacillus pumilus]MCY7500227.1 hypothetical protein [Bacillus pumilus]MCY7528449.1 hypothetical protein [Bacillus pumilus]MED4490036.1 hypothetical protein [Bacillus pumilus]